jgi:hypothetical protein
MSRQDPLPDDLAALGAQLEAAARRSLERRAALRRSLRQALVVVVLGAPLALLAGAKDVGDTSRPIEAVARLVETSAPEMPPYKTHGGLEHSPQVSLTASTQRPAPDPPVSGLAYFRRSN